MLGTSDQDLAIQENDNSRLLAGLEDDSRPLSAPDAIAGCSNTGQVDRVDNLRQARLENALLRSCSC